MIFDRRARIFLAITALLMASAIAFGAFGAHGLKNILTAEMLKVFHTGVEYQFYNTFGLFMATVLTMLRPYNKKLKVAQLLILIGTLIFSISLYLLTILNLPILNIPEYIKPIHNTKAYCLVFGDEHYGAEFELKDLFGNIINSYSPEIFEERMYDLFDQTVEIIHKENIDTLNVYSMGDFSDGCLRASQLMKLRCGVVDGTIQYANFITNWLNNLTKHVHIKFQMTDGNHTELRMLGQPKGTFTEDNMGKVVREFIKIRLADNPNFTFIENPTGYIYGQLACNTVMGIHGEVRDMERALKDFSNIYNVPIQYLFAGHLHHSKVEEIGINSEVINVPSIIGVDPYSLSLNKTSNAAGKLIIFEKNKGKVCEYTLKLN